MGVIDICLLSAVQGDQHARGDGGADDACHVGAHSVHQQEVAGVVLLAHHLGHAGRHRHGGHTGGADEGIDLLLEEQVHELGQQNAAGGVLLAKFMNLFLKEKINPLIGSAGVSAVPMAARVSQMVGQKYNPGNFLLMHAMGPNVAGVIGSAIAAGVLISLYG